MHYTCIYINYYHYAEPHGSVKSDELFDHGWVFILLISLALRSIILSKPIHIKYYMVNVISARVSLRGTGTNVLVSLPLRNHVLS